MPRRLGNWIDSYLHYTEENESPDRFRKWVAISSVAAALQRKVSFPWIGPGITLYPNMYIVLVGPSGVRKGSSIAPAKRLLDKANVYLGPDWTTKEALVQKFLESAGEDMLALATGGALHNHHSLTIWAEELAVFLRSKAEDLHPVLCQLFDANKLHYYTKQDGEQELHRVWFNFLGATVPSALKNIFPVDQRDHGLISRINFVFDDKKSKVVTRYQPTTEDEKLEKDLIFDLKQIKKLSGVVTPTEEWWELYEAWSIESEMGEPVTYDPRFGGYQERRRGHLIKLSIIMNAARCDDLRPEKIDFVRAKQLLEESEWSMQKAFASSGGRDNSAILDSVIELVARTRSIKFSELLSRYIYDIEEDKLLKMVTGMGTAGLVELKKDGNRDYRITWKEQA